MIITLELEVESREADDIADELAFYLHDKGYKVLNCSVGSEINQYG